MSRHRIFLLLLIGSNLCIHADTSDIQDFPRQTPYYRANVHYTVTLPMTDEEIEYEINLSVAPSLQDSLNNYYRYLITYQPRNTPDAESRFALYENGHYYRFERQRLREYHRERQPELFAQHKNKRPIQLTGLFTDLLPAEIRRTLLQLSGDSCTAMTMHADTIVHGLGCHALDITQFVQDEAVRQCLYCFDKDNAQPLFIKIENNPHGLGAQSIEAIYQHTDTTVFPVSEISENALLKRWGDVMARYRKDHYKATSLHGKDAPRFSLPLFGTTNRRELDTPTESPLILLFTDTHSHYRTETYTEVERIAMQQNVPLYVIFTEANPDDISEEIGGMGKPYAQMLYHGGKTALEYGVTGYPTLFVVNTDGKISFVQIGYTPETASKLNSHIESILLNNPI